MKHDVRPERRIWLKEEPAAPHNLVYDVALRLGEVLPPLRQLHFISRGDLHYCSEIVEALDLMQQANGIARENPSYQRFSPKVFADTAEAIPKEIDSAIGIDTLARRAFDEFVDRMQQLVVAKP